MLMDRVLVCSVLQLCLHNFIAGPAREADMKVSAAVMKQHKNILMMYFQLYDTSKKPFYYRSEMVQT